MKIQDRIALVTGASTGIGRAVVAGLARRLDLSGFDGRKP